MAIYDFMKKFDDFGRMDAQTWFENQNKTCENSENIKIYKKYLEIYLTKLKK